MNICGIENKKKAVVWMENNNYNSPLPTGRDLGATKGRCANKFGQFCVITKERDNDVYYMHEEGLTSCCS